MELLTTVPLLIIDDLGMRKLPLTAAEELLEIIMRRYERASTLLTSNRPVEDWGKLLGDSAAVSAMLDRLLHHGHVLKCGPRSWRTKTSGDGRNPMTKAKAKTIRMPGKERPAASRLVIQGLSTTEPHHRNPGRNTKPSASQPSGKPQRVSITDSFGASPASSALDHSARRDPGGANTTLTRIQNALNIGHNCNDSNHALPNSPRQGKTITSSANPMAGFELTTYGRF